MLSNNNPFIIDWACAPGFTESGNAISDYFDKMYISYQMKCTKPDLKIFKMMIEDSGINPSESLFVDDGKININAAEACGFQACLVQNGTDWREKINAILVLNN